MQMKSGKPSRQWRASLISRLSFIAAIAVSVSTQPAPTCAREAREAQDQAAQEVRFAVAHQLSFSWCYGYLYVSADKVRYEVSQPESCRNHSFEAPRTQVTVRQWTILGRPQDAIELKVKGATYHMRWLANESEVNTGGAKRMTPPTAAAPATLIAAIQNPESLVAQNPSSNSSNASAGTRMPVGNGPGNANSNSAMNPAPSNSTALSTSSTTTSTSAATPIIASASAEAPHKLPPGMLQGVYVCTGGGDSQPTNKQYIFYPDGLMVYGVPEDGMLGFDFDHYRSESNRERNWVGRYQVDREKVKIVWQNQFGDPAHPVLIKINETSAHPAWDPGWDTFIPMCRCTGKTFSGKYRWGSPAADQYLEFFADGTFIDHRVTDQLIVPSPFYSHPRIQRGMYSIQSQTILFSFTDGHRGTRTFLAPKAQENQLLFDWIELGRQQLFEDHYQAEVAR